MTITERDYTEEAEKDVKESMERMRNLKDKAEKELRRGLNC